MADSVLIGTILQALKNANIENPVLVISQDIYEGTKSVMWGMPIKVNPTLRPNTFYIESRKGE